MSTLATCFNEEKKRGSSRSDQGDVGIAEAGVITVVGGGG
jgi:hypothetical protein